MNQSLKKIITTSTILLSGMHIINQYIDIKNTPPVSSKLDKSFKWKDMNIIYSEKGNPNGPLLLLVHRLYPDASKDEWYLIDEELSKDFHIFEIDLPGCGKSDKENITYINYMYVQIISDFIRKIAGTKVNICTASYSGSFIFMAARIHPELFEKIIVINPPSLLKFTASVTKKSECMKKILELPVIGTFLYNCRMSRPSVLDDYKYTYFYNKENVPEKAVDISYFNGHYNHSNGRYLLASILGNYTNINIIHALPKIDNEIYLIGNETFRSTMHEYEKYGKNIKISIVSSCRLLPQLEIPNTITNKIKAIFALESSHPQ